VGCAAEVVEPTGVTLERQPAPFDTQSRPRREIELKAQPESRGDGGRRLGREGLTAGQVGGTTLRGALDTAVRALSAADECRAAEQVEVGVDVDALEDTDLAAERHQRQLWRRHPIDGAELLAEVAAHVDTGQ